jgi:hypothetical protein
LLAYLQLVDNPHFVPAFTRIVNVPPRGIGEKGGFSSFLRLNLMSLIYYTDTRGDISSCAGYKYVTDVGCRPNLQWQDPGYNTCDQDQSQDIGGTTSKTNEVG